MAIRIRKGPWAQLLTGLAAALAFLALPPSGVRAADTAAQKTNADGANAPSLHIAASATDVKPLATGAAVPEVTLETAAGKNVLLTKVLAEKPTVLVFYRGFWCPFCNRHLQQLQDKLQEIQDAGYQVVAISPDTPERAKGTIERHKLTYTVLCDPDHKAMAAFGVAFDSHNPTFPVLPVPSVFLIKDGTIEYVHYNPDYTARMAPAEIVKQIKAADATSK